MIAYYLKTFNASHSCHVVAPQSPRLRLARHNGEGPRTQAHTRLDRVSFHSAHVVRPEDLTYRAGIPSGTGALSAALNTEFGSNSGFNSLGGSLPATVSHRLKPPISQVFSVFSIGFQKKTNFLTNTLLGLTFKLTTQCRVVTRIVRRTYGSSHHAVYH